MMNTTRPEFTVFETEPEVVNFLVTGYLTSRAKLTPGYTDTEQNGRHVGLIYWTIEETTVLIEETTVLIELAPGVEPPGLVTGEIMHRCNFVKWYAIAEEPATGNVWRYEISGGQGL